jgi:hypothetical protein
MAASSVTLKCKASPDQWALDDEDPSKKADNLVAELRKFSEFAESLSPMGKPTGSIVTVTVSKD